jgi:hypothetical protein
MGSGESKPGRPRAVRHQRFELAAMPFLNRTNDGEASCWGMCLMRTSSGDFDKSAADRSEPAVCWQLRPRTLPQQRRNNATEHTFRVRPARSGNLIFGTSQNTFNSLGAFLCAVAPRRSAAARLTLHRCDGIPAVYVETLALNTGFGSIGVLREKSAMTKKVDFTRPNDRKASLIATRNLKGGPVSACIRSREYN